MLQKGWKSQTTILSSQEQSGGFKKSSMIEVAARTLSFLPIQTKTSEQFLAVRFSMCSTICG
jgi:hypothetical protein